ncbi:helix-hairpin-helix domain-containing protein [Antarcticibacterium sp. 1MA-6-2]|uniref:ComEA family DNA-binding protein n=1 Tax=Antarcticibacterium sp. 1MA-6-2 TaxID=2908210 RepID=UPI001F43F3E9|nr:helix-hairpin-helix domain-containing protein [Antarcticibacterium sp. 1MA-6-2]UJH92430.1 helix-hairpin-helix domain-containing protein [Antarcticibacterium sp. 1MA-6-2]
MKNFKSHFVFNRSQQNGIFLLVGIIIALQLLYWFGAFSSSSENFDVYHEDLVKFQQQIDSSKLASTVKDTAKIFPFNPNFITDYKGYTLGMSVEEIDRLHAFRAGDKWINSAEEFQEVTKVSDSLLKVISVYFQFPEWVKSNRNSASNRNSVSRTASPGIASSVEKKDLNAATVEELMEVRGIGETLAGRIVNYRNKIGGFVSDLQLKDIYGLSFEVRNEVAANFTVKNAPEVRVLNINTATVLELANIPYINYELAREIVNYRLLHEQINSFEELAKIKDFPSEKIDRIALYLALK